MKHIILTADDYGQNPEISAGIIDLIKKERLSATSCMTTSPHWQDQAKHLTPFADQIDIGLHFNLTEGESLSQQLSFTNVKNLIIKSHLKKLNLNAIKTELNAQIDAFIHTIGKLPDYIDGHQHIHHLPLIRDALLNCVEKRLSDKTYIRICRQKKGLLKNKIITATGATTLKNLCEKNNIPHNQSFSGIYNFKNAKNYRRLCQNFLDSLTNNGILMCHPGLPSNDKFDTIKDSRPFEYNYFASDVFLSDLAKAKVTLGRFKTKELYTEQAY